MPMKRQDPMAGSQPLRYVPLAIYTFGYCHYGHTTPYRTTEVAADCLDDAWRMARLGPQIGSTEHLCHVATKPNPAFMQEQARWGEQVGLRRDAVEGQRQ